MLTFSSSRFTCMWLKPGPAQKPSTHYKINPKKPARRSKNRLREYNIEWPSMNVRLKIERSCVPKNLEDINMLVSGIASTAEICLLFRFFCDNCFHRKFFEAWGRGRVLFFSWYEKFLVPRFKKEPQVLVLTSTASDLRILESVLMVKQDNNYFFIKNVRPNTWPSWPNIILLEMNEINLNM